MGWSMAKADVENLIEWKKRRGALGATFIILDDLRRLNRLWKSKAEDAKEFADFIPIRIVTIIEVFTREVIRELVDAGPPFLERAETLLKGAKLDHAFLAGLQGRVLSVGDIAAHAVSLSDPTRLIANLGALIPDFSQLLKASHPRWSEETEEWPLEPIIGDFNKMMESLTRLFAVRHIVTHELPNTPAFEIAEIASFLQSAAEFIEAIDWVLVDTLRGSVPRTQIAMNIEAGNSLNLLETEMDKLVTAIKERGEVDHTLLDETQEAWTSFAAKEAKLHASRVEGGSMYPMIWAGAMGEEAKKRIETLRWWAEREIEL